MHHRNDQERAGFDPAFSFLIPARPLGFSPFGMEITGANISVVCVAIRNDIEKLKLRIEGYDVLYGKTLW